MFQPGQILQNFFVVQNIFYVRLIVQVRQDASQVGAPLDAAAIKVWLGLKFLSKIEIDKNFIRLVGTLSLQKTHTRSMQGWR